MKVLVTGGAGYLGTVTTQLLLERGDEVVVLDNLLHGRESISQFESVANYQLIEGDIRSLDLVERALEGVDHVVHLAAIVGDPACAAQPELTHAVNLDASLALWKACQKAGVKRFLFASTCSNYGRMEDPESYVSESSELRPISLYAETKVAFERELLEAQASGQTSPSVMRFATLFGLSPRMRYDLTVNEFTRDLIRNRHLVVYGEQFWRPYVHVHDAGRAILMVLDADAQKVSGQVFNVGDTTENYRKGELVHMICEKIGGDLRIERIVKDEDPRDYRVSFDRIREVLDFSITRTVSDGIQEVIGAV